MTIQLQTATAAFRMTGGIYTLTTLELHSADLTEISGQLESMTQMAPNFFGETPVVVACEKLQDEDTEIDFYRLRCRLHQFGLIVVAIRGDKRHKKKAMVAGISWLPTPNENVSVHEQEYYVEGEENSVVIMQKSVGKQKLSGITGTHTEQPVLTQKTTLIEHPVRSGQQIYAEGHLVITNQVSSGAEVLAAGDIHVYGPLRGRALAGVNGSADARIFCLQFEAELVSINGQYKMASADHKSDPVWGCGVIVSLDEQSLHIKKL